jgi:ABC-2 type transport system ATP-binding protein
MMINLNNLTFFYQVKKPVLSTINLQLNKGSVVGILGKNGTGKTTLLHLLAGLLEPGQGEAFVNGFVPFDRNPKFLSDIYFVPETLYIENLSINNYVRAYAPFYPKFDSIKFDRLIDAHKLSKSSKMVDLSTGQAKQMILSFALSTNVSLLLLDEPTNALDIPSKDTFKKLIAAETWDDQTVIISTHQSKDIELLIDHVVIVQEEKIVLNKSISELQDQYNFEKTDSLALKAVLYSQSLFGGYNAILKHQGYDTSLDLELLFYAASEGTQL